MKDQIKKFLNEDQDPKAIEKVTSKLNDLLMRGEEVGYIGVQKKPVTVFPDSIVVTNKRIILCKPKNLGLSMEFIDFEWSTVEAVFIKENILGSVFWFTTKTDLTVDIDYIPKNQARKLYTYSKEQLDILNNPVVAETTNTNVQTPADKPEVEEIETEEVTSFAELMPTVQPKQEFYEEPIPTQTQNTSSEKKLSEMSSDELFAKLQNYKKLLDNGLILQGEYDNFKKEILSYM